MRIFPFSFQRKSATRLVDIDEAFSEAVINGLSDGAGSSVQPKSAYNMSERNLDLGKAVSDIAATIAGLKKGLSDGDDLDFDNPLIAMLNNPGGGSSASQFWKNGAESFLLTNEFWVVARGQINREPLELLAIRPFDVHVSFSQKDGLPSFIETRSSRDRRTYYREASNNNYRYIDKAGLNEIIPIIGTTSLSDDWRGRSPLSKLFYDIKLSTDGKRHNVSLLKNGMRTTGILSPAAGPGPGTTWSEPAINALAERLRSFNQGSGSAGNIVVSNIPMKIDGLSQSNRDMDFLNLLKVSRESIYNLYSYPLPLVLSDTMTMDNYTVAQQAFYTEAVFPVYNEIAAGIMSGLGSRYDLDPSKMTLSFSEADIQALREVRVQAMEKLKTSEAVSINEIRKAGGFTRDPLGDVTLVSAGKLPLSIVSGPSFDGTAGDE